LIIPGDWRHGADPAAIEAKLAADRLHTIRAVLPPTLQADEISATHMTLALASAELDEEVYDRWPPTFAVLNVLTSLQRVG